MEQLFSRPYLDEKAQSSYLRARATTPVRLTSPIFTAFCERSVIFSEFFKIFLFLKESIDGTNGNGELHRLWSFKYAEKQFRKCMKANPNEGGSLLRLFKCLLLQFMENLFDRECERFLQENTAAKWFCGFSLLGAQFGVSVK